VTGHSPGPWRTGRKVGRTIYDANDRLIGVMDRVEDAQLSAAAPELLRAADELAEATAERDSLKEQVRGWQDADLQTQAALAGAIAERDRLRAVLAETEENVAALRGPINQRGATVGAVARRVLAALRARAGEEPPRLPCGHPDRVVCSALPKDGER
jgi:hypothetical protein